MYYKVILLMFLILTVNFCCWAMPEDSSDTLFLKSNIENKKFSLECDGLTLNEICLELSIYYNINVVCHTAVSELKIKSNFENLTLEKSLDLVSWLSGVDWYIKDSIYYIGGNDDYIEVLDNHGMTREITGVFGEKLVRIIEDKIVITGTEKEVKRISTAIQKMQSKKHVEIHIVGYDVTEEKLIQLGINIDKSLKYSTSYSGLLASGGNPFQHLALSLAASVEASESSNNVNQIINTTLTCISGKKQKIHVGEEIDRKLNSTNEYGNTYTSSFNTIRTGYTVEISPYYYKNEDWLLDCSIVNSDYQTDERRSLMTINNTILLSDTEVMLIGRVIKGTKKELITKGVPFFCDIPILGRLFRVTTEEDVQRNLLFFVSKNRIDSRELFVTPMIETSKKIKKLGE